MKQLILLIAMMCIGGYANAQTLDRTVISAGGDGSSTIGEIAIATVQSGNFQSTQGFQQGDTLTLSVNISERENLPIQVKVFPNPATSYFTVEAPGNSNLMLQIFSLSGQLLTSRELSSFQEKFDVSQFAAGTYVVILIDEQGQKVADAKIQKI